MTSVTGQNARSAARTPSTIARTARRWAVPLALSFLALALVLWRLKTGAQLLQFSSVHTQFDTASTQESDAAQQESRTNVKLDRAVEPEPESAPIDIASDGVRTQRIGCREYPKGGQSCVLQGIACVDVNEKRTKGVVRPRVYLIDDARRDGDIVSNDRWCQLRHRSSDPRYFASREWPPRYDLFAPRHSCLNAYWRTKSSLFRNYSSPARVRWLDELALIDLDYVNNDHNNHYVKDIVWLLDVVLWQKALNQTSTLGTRDHLPQLFPDHPKHVFMPQGIADFDKQTRRDVNRLNFALIFGLDPRELYRGQHRLPDNKIWTRPLRTSYPQLKERLVFYGNERVNTTNDLVCTRKMIVGSKLGDMGHERVCQYLRQESWRLYDIAPPQRAVSGYLHYERPPRRVVLLQRHITRRIRNLDAVTAALRNAARKHVFEFELHSTAELKNAEDHVRFFSRIGVLLTPHGSQAMGAMWMPRHAALIEVFPPAYTDFAFNLLSSACNIWYFEIQASVPADLKKVYEQRCGKKIRSFYDQCVQLKSLSIDVDVDEAVRNVLFALKRLGHDITPPQ